MLAMNANRASGITSACAEQTSNPVQWWDLSWDHLRVCGADCWVFSFAGWDGGSPPRVRSRRQAESSYSWPPGITSACAEQTESSGLAFV